MRVARVSLRLAQVMLLVAVAAVSVAVARQVTSVFWKPFGRSRLSQVHG
jgi:hypothetical protein